MNIACVPTGTAGYPIRENIPILQKQNSFVKMNTGISWGEGQMSRAYSVVVRPLLIASCIVLIAAGSAAAQIVAVGASGTAGTGVGPGQAYPEVLTKLLAARGYQLQVANAGVRGIRASGMLARLDAAVPTGTKIAILDLDGPRFNNMRFGNPPQRGNAEDGPR